MRDWTGENKWRWRIAAAGAVLYALRLGLEAEPPRWLWGLAAGLLGAALAYLVEACALSALPLALLWLYVLWPVYAPSLALGVGVVALVALAAEVLHSPLTRMRSGASSDAERGLVIPFAFESRLRFARRAHSTDFATAQALDRPPLGPPLMEGVVLALALALYVATLAPTILPADSGEFQIVGPLLGVAHPPGYALFTMLVKLFSLLPAGEVAWRVNLMGAVTGALTLAVVARTGRRIGGTPWAGIAAAGALGLSTTFWAQATTINIRMLTMLWLALCCDALVRFVQAPPGSAPGGRALTALALSFGLAVSHHASAAFFAPLFGALIVWHDRGLIRRVRQWLGALLVFAAPFAADLYIVARALAGAPFGTEELVDAGRVIDHLLGRGFSGDMFAFLHLDRVLGERFLVIANILDFQFGLPLLILAAIGLAWLARREFKIALLLGGMAAIMAFIVATYRAPQSVEYLMPAYIPIALCVGCAAALAARVRAFPGAPARTPGAGMGALNALLVGVVLLPGAYMGLDHLPSYLALHRDRSAREYAESVLLDAPPQAHILSNWHWYTPLRYLQLVEGLRPDVQVTYLYPQGATAMPQAWPQRIARELAEGERPLVVTNWYPTYVDLPYRFEPLGQAFLVRAAPSHDAAAYLLPLEIDLAGEKGIAIRLLGYRVLRGSVTQPGEQVTVDLAWQPLVPLEQGLSFFVHLVGEDGVPLGQHDLSHPGAPSYAPGEVLVDRYEFPVFLTAAPGTYTLVAGAYVTLADGSWQRLTVASGPSAGGDALALSPVTVEGAPQPPLTMHAAHRSFAGGPALVGVDYDDSLPGQRRVYLHWRGNGRPAVVRLYAGRRGGEGQPPLAEARVPAAEGYTTVALDVPPGTGTLRLSLFSANPVGAAGPSGADNLLGALLPARGMWGLARSAPLSLPGARSGARYLPFGGKMALAGVQTGATWRAGEETRVALRWLGLRPIVDDYVVSVSVRGAAGTLGQSDGVPAIGAIPTFKWIRGSEVRDVHLVDLGANAGGPAELTLGVYDAFTSRALPPMDERIARQGRAAVTLEAITIE